MRSWCWLQRSNSEVLVEGAMARIFVSHSSADNPSAIALVEWLASAGWDDVFLDLDSTRGIAAGERWEQCLYEAANRCEAVVFLISRAWLSSEWCVREYDLAVRLSKRIFGVIIEVDGVSAMPARLSGTWQLVNLAQGEDHRIFRVTLPSGTEAHVTFSRAGLRRLKVGLGKAGLDPRFFAWPPASDTKRAPYRGMLALEEEDAGIFFGREAPIVAALDQLRRMAAMAPPRIMAILGASGAGKSSFLRAGLLPRLARDDLHFLPLPPIRPTNKVLSGETGLLRSLERAFEAREIPRSRSELRAEVARGAPGVLRLLGDLSKSAAILLNGNAGEGAGNNGANATLPTLVLPIDQGEELFATAGREETDAFLPLLRDLLLTTEFRLIVLMTIRSDAFEQLQSEVAFAEAPATPFNLPPLPLGSYQAVIEGPAERLKESERPLTVEPALTAALLNDLEEGGTKDSLPLLAFTLERLFTEHGGDGALRLSEYLHLGRLKGSIEAAAARVINSREVSDRVPEGSAARIFLMRRAFIPWLAGIDPDTLSPRRRVALLSEIPAESRPLVHLLVAERLLSLDVSAVTGETTVEPAHEALLRQWGLLQGWLDEDMAALSSLEALLRAGRDWVAHQKDEAWLVHAGGRLEDAEALLLRADLAARLDPTDREYLQAARARESAQRDRELEDARRFAEAQRQIAERQQQLTRRTLFGALSAAVLAVVAIITAGYGWQQASEAELQRSEAVKQAGRANVQSKRAVAIAAKEEAARLEAEKQRAAAQEQHAIAERRLREASTSQVQLLAAMTKEQADGGKTALAMLLASAATKLVPNGDLRSTAVLERNAWHACRLNREIASIKAKDPTAALLVGDIALIAERSGRLLMQKIESEFPMQSVDTQIDGLRFLVFDSGSKTIVAASETQIRVSSIGHPPANITLGEKRIATLDLESTSQPRLRVVYQDATVGLYRLDNLSLVETIGHPQNGNVNAALSWDLKKIAYAQQSIAVNDVDTDVHVRLLDANSPEVKLVGHENIVRALALSMDGSVLATGSDDKTIKLWDLKTGTLLRNLEGHSAELRLVVFRSDGAAVASADNHGEIRLWNTATGQQRISPIRGQDDAIVDLRFDPTGNMLISTASDGTVRVWDAREGRETVFSRGIGDSWSEETAWNDAARGTPKNASDLILDRQRCAERLTIGAAPTPKGSNADYLPLAISENGMRVASVGLDGVLTVSDASRTDLVEVDLGLQDRNILGSVQINFSPTLDAVAYFTDRQQAGTTRIGYGIVSLSGAGAIAWSDEPASQIMFTADSKHVLVRLADGRLRGYRVSTGVLLLDTPPAGDNRGGTITTAFDPSLLLILEPGRIKIWDPKTGIDTLQTAPGATLMASLSDDRRYAVISTGDYPEYHFEFWDIVKKARLDVPSALKNFTSDDNGNLRFLQGSDVLVRKISSKIELWHPTDWLIEGKFTIGQYETVVAFDRKLGRIIRNDGNFLSVWSFPEGKALWSHSLPEDASLLGAEPCGTGRRLIFGDTFDPYILDLEAGEILRVLDTGSSSFYYAKCIDKGHQVVIRAADQLSVFDYPSDYAERFAFLSQHLHRCLGASELEQFGLSFLSDNACKPP
ncbi:TIR domain-containing protein [Rhizobium ruizarguesonis]|nr:TIR domain-containing protein [Rhizobium ruizarguesonis]